MYNIFWLFGRVISYIMYICIAPPVVYAQENEFKTKVPHQLVWHRYHVGLFVSYNERCDVIAILLTNNNLEVFERGDLALHVFKLGVEGTGDRIISVLHLLLYFCIYIIKLVNTDLYNESVTLGINTG